MDYEKTYNKLIAAARTQQIDGYYETHHIIPKSEGGFCDPNTVWWNNGVKNKRCVAQPGPEWQRGRFKNKRSSEN